MSEKRYAASLQEQLDKWVAGESLCCRRELGGHVIEECCPDFSCCKPDLLQPVQVRRDFAAADERKRMEYLGMFLGALMATHSDKKVHLVAGEPKAVH